MTDTVWGVQPTEVKATTSANSIPTLLPATSTTSPPPQPHSPSTTPPTTPSPQNSPRQRPIAATPPDSPSVIMKKERRRASIREAIAEGIERQTMVSSEMVESYLKNINTGGGEISEEVLKEELVVENQSLRIQFEKVININLALSRALNEANEEILELKSKVQELEALLPKPEDLAGAAGGANATAATLATSMPVHTLSTSSTKMSASAGTLPTLPTSPSNNGSNPTTPRTSLLLEQKNLFPRSKRGGNLPNRVIQSSYVPASHQEGDGDYPSPRGGPPGRAPPRTPSQRKPTLGLDLLGKARKTTVAFKSAAPRIHKKERKSLTYEEILAESLHRERAASIHEREPGGDWRQIFAGQANEKKLQRFNGYIEAYRNKLQEEKFILVGLGTMVKSYEKIGDVDAVRVTMAERDKQECDVLEREDNLEQMLRMKESMELEVAEQARLAKLKFEQAWANAHVSLPQPPQQPLPQPPQQQEDEEVLVGEEFGTSAEAQPATTPATTSQEVGVDTQPAAPATATATTTATTATPTTTGETPRPRGPVGRPLPVPGQQAKRDTTASTTAPAATRTGPLPTPPTASTTTATTPTTPTTSNQPPAALTSDIARTFKSKPLPPSGRRLSITRPGVVAENLKRFEGGTSTNSTSPKTASGLLTTSGALAVYSSPGASLIASAGASASGGDSQQQQQRRPDRELVRQISKRGLELIEDVRSAVTLEKLDELKKIIADQEAELGKKRGAEPEEEVETREFLLEKMKEREEDMKMVLKKDPSRLSMQLNGPLLGASLAASALREAGQQPQQQEGTEAEEGPTEVYGIFDFEGLEEDELSFNIGDKITIIKQIDAHWFYGDLDGNKGIFPSVYVTASYEEAQKQHEQLLQLQSDENAEQGATTATTSGGSLTTSTGERRVVSYPVEDGAEPLIVEVLYDFDGIEDDEELTCHEGDMIRIIGEMEGYPEWIKGESNGRQGWVPRTYLNIE